MEKNIQTIGQQIFDAYARVESPADQADFFGPTMIDSAKAAEFDSYIQAIVESSMKQAREDAALDAVARVLTVLNATPGQHSGATLARAIHKSRKQIITEVPAYVHKKSEK